MPGSSLTGEVFDASSFDDTDWDIKPFICEKSGNDCTFIDDLALLDAEEMISYLGENRGILNPCRKNPEGYKTCGNYGGQQ